MKSQNELLMVDFDTLKQMEGFPSSKKEFRTFIKSRRPKANPGKAILWILAIMLVNILFLTFINDSCFFGYGRFNNATWLAYIFGGVIMRNSGVKGSDFLWFRDSQNTALLAFSFSSSLLLLIGSLRHRIKATSASQPLKDLLAIPKTLTHFGVNSVKGVLPVLFPHIGFGLILAFLVKNPFSICFFAIFLLLEFGAGAESGVMAYFYLRKIATSLDRPDRPKIIKPGDTALPFLGVGLGFLLHTLFGLYLWFRIDYATWARLLCTVVLAALMFVIGYGLPSGKKPRATIAAIVFAVSFIGFRLIAHADDGGWSESGSLSGLFSNSGFGHEVFGGFFSAFGAVFSAAFSQSFNSVLDSVTHGVGSAAYSVFSNGVPGSPEEVSNACLNAAFGSVGPFGEMIGSAWSQASSALAGDEGAGSSSDSGSSGFGGGSSGDGGSGGSHGPSNPHKPNPDPSKPEDEQ